MGIKQGLNTPPETLAEYTMLIGGPKNAGKSSFIAGFEDHTIAELEPGNAKHLKANFTDCGNLTAFDKWLNEAKDTNWVKTWGLDEFNVIYQWCLDKVCFDLDIADPGDVGYAKGWKAIERGFNNRLIEFLALPGGHIFTAHTGEKTFKTRESKEVTRTVFEISKAAKRFIDAKVHLMAQLEFAHDGSRILIIQGDDLYEAGTKGLDFRFKTPEGRSLKVIRMGTSPAEGYNNLMLAFNNQLEEDNEAYLIGGDTTSLPVKTKPQFKVSFKKGK